MSLLNNLKPQRKAEKVHFEVYSDDAQKFKAALAYLNKDLEETQGAFTEQDLFSELLGQLSQLEGFDEYLLKMAHPRRGRRKKNTGQENPNQ